MRKKLCQARQARPSRLYIQNMKRKEKFYCKFSITQNLVKPFVCLKDIFEYKIENCVQLRKFVGCSLFSIYIIL